MNNQKIIYIISIFFVCFIIFGCGKQEYSRVLVQIDSLSNVRPDSAIKSLQELEGQTQKLSKSDQMYYKLLKIKADDKAYIQHKSDKDILQIVNYFEKENDKELLPWAYYYAGSVYRDLNDAEQSLDYFYKAQNSTDNPYVKGLCNVAIGYIFWDREMYNIAGNSFLSAYKYDKQRNDVEGMIFDLRDIGRNYWERRMVDSTFFYFLKGLHLAMINHNKRMTSSLKLQMAVVYIQQSKYIKARKCLNECLENIDSAELFTYHHVLASYYVHVNKKDSAAIHYLKSFNSNNIYRDVLKIN